MELPISEKHFPTMDFISPAILVGASAPLLALHSYLVSTRKNKALLRPSFVVSILAVFAALFWVWSIEQEKSLQNANGLAAALAVWISVAGILLVQLVLLGVDLFVRIPEPRSYLSGEKTSDHQPTPKDHPRARQSQPPGIG